MTFLHFMEILEAQDAYNRTADPRTLTQDISMELDDWNCNIEPSLRNTFAHPADHWNDQMMQYWGELPEKACLTADNPMSFQPQGLQMEFFDHFAAQSFTPFAYELPRTSPTPSQGISVWSDSVSSLSDEESALDGLMDYYAYGNNGIRHSLPGAWTETFPVPPQAQDTEHITLKDIQRSMDPQELLFQHGEEALVEDLNDSTRTPDAPDTPHGCLIYPFRTTHTAVDNPAEQLIESELRAKSIEEVADGDISIAKDDGEEEDDDGEPEVEYQTRDREAKDDDYHPGSARNKPRRSSRVTTSSPNNKRAKIIKSTTRPKLVFRCNFPGCSHAAKDAQSLVRHTTTVHTRPFVCAFGFAGCTGTFGSKNEWKRHVSSQHLALHSWRCELGQCGQIKKTACKAKDGCTEPRGSDFNRKDLFTQHLRRMHAPMAVRRQNKKSSEWDTQVKRLQEDCLKVRRQPPRKTMCPVESCGQAFEGTGCWDARMEHVGKHLEREAGKTDAGSAIDQGKDYYLIDYALKEKIIERAADGSYVLCRNGSFGTDEDAECEFE